MKKNLFSMGVMLAAAFTLTNCAKEVQDPNVGEKTPYTIYANTAETKTANDGLSTVWVEGDALTVFATAAGSTEYGTSSKFTLTDAASGKFETDDLKADLAATNDWYALYPYSSYVTTPASTDAGYINVGAVSIQQKGYDNMEHLSGTNCPLYGVAKAVPGADMPTITMNHLSSVVAINITNDTDKELLVTTASLTAEEEIVGSFYIDYTATSIDYTPSEGYTNKTATVNVSEGTALAKGEFCILYLAIKPFTASSGSKLTLSVNGYSKELDLKNDVTFSAGKIKTLNFSYNKVANPNVPAFEAGKYWIVANDKYAMPLTGNYGYLKVDNAGYTDNVYTFADVDGGYTIQQADGKYLYMTGTYDSFNVSATIPSAGGHVWTIEQNDDGSYKILNVLKAKYIQLDSQYGTYGSYNTVKGTMPNLVPADDATVRPIFTVDSNSKRVASDVTEASFEITSNQNWTVVPGAGVSADITSGNGDATVTLNFAENKSTDDIVYTATVKANGFEDIVLTVTQEGVAVDGAETLTIVLSGATRPCDNFPNTSAGVTTTTTYTIGGYDWTFSPSSGNKFSWYSDQKYILWGKSGGYILMPAVEGKRLTSVTILTGKNASTNVKVGVYTEDGKTAVDGGESIMLNKQNAEFNWTLTNTEVNTHYQLRVTSAYNAQLQQLTLIYK